MMSIKKKRISPVKKVAERGQAIILVALAMVGLVGMVGLVTDTGILLINYGKLKRGVDAAAIAAAQQYRTVGNASSLDPVALENTAKNFLQLNQAEGVTDIDVHSCDLLDPARPALCNPDPVGDPDKNRKLVEVSASADIKFGFLSVLGIKSTTISATSIGEAATLDVVLIIDNSASMAYETISAALPTDANPETADPDDRSALCNGEATEAYQCQPMKAVKQVALDFISTLYFPYDRVSVITMTPNVKGGDNFETSRAPTEVIPLTSVKQDVEDAIRSIKVFEPRNCASDTPDPNVDPIGSCVLPTSKEPVCPYYLIAFNDVSPCYSSNIGGALYNARVAFTGSNGLVSEKLDSFWVVVAVLGGHANATNVPRFGNGSVDPAHPFGYCPAAYATKHCYDYYPWVRHDISDDANYDADDYTRDQADELATLISGEGVTIYTIGLGNAVQKTTTVASGQPAEAETLFKYIAECAGEGDADDCLTPVTTPQINHGQYFFSPTSQGLADIFVSIANNIATKISQ